ncbi:MAG: hydroxyisourate hydrolase [Arenicellales bacterium]
MGKLTTHVLDTARGQPAAGVAWSLNRSDAPETVLNSGITNSDGRVDGPILEGSAFTCGTYELRFSVGDYFRQQGVSLESPSFLDIVVIRFGISDASEHYHVPLLVSPFGYSTYRGS